MKKKRKTRVELYKEDIEESKMYHSIEKQTLNDSQILKAKKEFLKKLDHDYFQGDIEAPTKTIQPLEKAKLFDYKLSARLANIKNALIANSFDIPYRPALSTKMDMEQDITQLLDQIKDNNAKFKRDIDYHEINFNSQISQLKAKWAEIEKNQEQDVEDDILEMKEIHDNLFDQTKGYKINLTKTGEIPKSSSTKVLKPQVYYVGLALILLLLIWSIRS